MVVVRVYRSLKEDTLGYFQYKGECVQAMVNEGFPVVSSVIVVDAWELQFKQLEDIEVYQSIARRYKEKGLTSTVAVAAALDEEMKLIHNTRVQNILKRD
ncbi:hypothetical protein ACL5YN_21655 [Bacillus pacificus]|uniref:hypothetical protein n=1 Tax=Bacillus pacificus TaxID=2026187 RepID=UPI001E58FAEE|nr:hypothetical protein [Bacillus pacificus]UEP95059.1 hypothetical protein LMD38_01250 [Bacillus pacificus]HDR7897469.1 hypothetical protein [Bacillus pacificus]